MNGEQLSSDERVRVTNASVRNGEPLRSTDP